MGEVEGRELLKRYGIPIPKGGVAKNREEAVKIAESIGYPVVMKVISKDIIHKTDADVVRLDINNPEEVREKFLELIKNAENYFKSHDIKDGKIQGILVEEQVKGFEFILGAKRDELFGNTIMFGTGGVYAELIKDITFRLSPLSHQDIEDMFQELKSKKVIYEGFRNIKVNKKSLVNVIKQTSRLIENEGIEEMDINPLICNDKRCLAADVRILL